MSTQASSAEPASSPPENWLRGFWGLFFVQSQGALSDNIFKFLVLFSLSNLIQDENERNTMVSIVLATFSIPFILLSMGAGCLADKFSKRKIVLGTKWFELFVMSAGTLSLAIQNKYLMLAVVFMMSVQSTFFGPAKYGLLPELLPKEKLSWGNGLLGFGTFVCIILGGIVAGVLYEKLGDNLCHAGGILICLSLIGLACSHLISRLPAADPNRHITFNIYTELKRNLKQVRSDRVLFLAILGSTYFWFIGAVFSEPTILDYGKNLLDLSETQVGYLRAFLALGIGVGSALAGFLSRGKIEHGFILMGACILSILAGALFIPGLSFLQVGICLFFLGMGGGFFVVPINALIQSIPTPETKGSVIATNNWLTSVGVFMASGFFWILSVGLGLAANQIFLVGSISTAAGAIAIAKLAPKTLERLKSWVGMA